MAVQNTMLIVDDIEMNRAMLLEIFANEYQTLTAEDGRQAMDALQRQDVDIVLLDLSMPVMDGYEVIAAMKAQPRLSEIPIVVTTGVVDNDERRAFDLGADDFVLKPYDPYIVHKRVDNLVHKYVLQMENLKQALDHSEQLTRARADDLLQTSREMRTPIHSILGACGELDKLPDLPPSAKKLADGMRDSAKYLLGLTSVLPEAAPASGVKIARSPFECRGLLQSVADMYASPCEQKELRLNVSTDGLADEYLFGDAARLRQALMHLMYNAVRFTPVGGKVSLEARRVSHAGGLMKVVFAVCRSGVAECDDERSEDEQELNVVRQLAEMMGGTVRAESEANGDRRILCELTFETAREQPTATDARLSSLRALVVEEDEETRRYLQNALKKLTLACDAAGTGDEAVQMLQSAKEAGGGFDICFVGWNAREPYGQEAVHKLREALADEPIMVAVAADETPDMDGEAQVTGVRAVLPQTGFQAAAAELLAKLMDGQHDTESAAQARFNGQTVLLAEDNRISAEACLGALARLGLTAERAENGQEACERFAASANGCYAAILMDEHMPVLGGAEATERIRGSAHPQAQTIPIIAVTANAFVADVKALMAAGASAQLAKPIDEQKLHDTLARFIAD